MPNVTLHLTPVVVARQDGGTFLHDFGGMEVEIATMWALSEFTVENGATHIVPGCGAAHPAACCVPRSV